MEEQLNYQPVSFEGIVPVLDVGDPSQAFARSLQGAIQGEQANLNQMQRNAEIESKNLEKKLEGFNKLAAFSQKAYQTYREIDNAVLKNELAELFAETYNRDDISTEQFDKDETDAAQVQNEVQEGTTKVLRSTENPSAEFISNAFKLRDRASLRDVVVHNATVLKALESYTPAVDKYFASESLKNLEPGAAYEAALQDFHKLWGDKTGLSQANQQFLAKYVYPKMRKEAGAHREKFTRAWNSQHAAKESLINIQNLITNGANDEKAWNTFVNAELGLTKADGVTMQTMADVFAKFHAADLPRNVLEKLGDATIQATGKQLKEHPEYLRALRSLRQRENARYSEDATAAKINMLDIIAAERARYGGAIPEERLLQLGSEFVRDFPNFPHIGDSVIRGEMANSARNQEIIREESRLKAEIDRLEEGEKLPVERAYNLPFELRERYKKYFEGDLNKFSTEEVIRKSENFKALKKGLFNEIGKALEFKRNAITSDYDRPSNYYEFELQATNSIVNRAQSLMLGSSNMSIGDALQTAKDEYLSNLEKNKDKLLKNDVLQVSGMSNLGLVQASGNVARQIQRATMDNFHEIFYEADYNIKPNQRYSERVRAVAARLGKTPKELTNIARQRKGLDPLPNSPQDDILSSVSRRSLNQSGALTKSPIVIALREDILSGKFVGGTAEQRTIALGQVLQAAGYYAWQHKDFKAFHGYTGSGQERVMDRKKELGRDSLHNEGRGKALDFALDNHTEAELDRLYAFFMKNKRRFGIKEILWRTKGHYDHLHVGLK